MFGGFGSQYFTAYHKAIPKSSPIDEDDDRIELYTLFPLTKTILTLRYHQLNHSSLFGGGGYRSSAKATMRRLVRKYGYSQRTSTTWFVERYYVKEKF